MNKHKFGPRFGNFYFKDMKLVHRIQNYIKEAENPSKIDKDSMVEDLRIKYKEYGRRQKCAFRALVFQAYKIILEMNKNLEDEFDAADRNPESESDVEIENLDNEDDEDENDDENNDEDDEGMELDDSVEISGELDLVPPHSAVSYMDRVEKMANSSRPKFASVSELINISSDEEDPLMDADSNADHQDSGNNNHIMQDDIPQHTRARKTINNYLMPNLPHVKITPIGRGTPTGRGMKRQSDAPLPTSKRQQTEPLATLVPNVSFKLFGGFSKILKTVSELVVHIKEAEIYETLGVNPPRGFLLHGPPGCGKTLLAQAIAGELEVPLVRVAGPELVGGVSGESESRIRDLFDTALNSAPCILFIDEIDAICPPRDTARREMERRIVAQLLTCIDGLSESLVGEKVAIIGATNRPDALDPALRRAGRFDREICLGIPDRTARFEILQVMTTGMKLKPGLDLEYLASATPGFVGADLKALTAEAAIAAVNRCLETQRKLREKNEIKATEEKEKETMVNGIDHSDEDKNTKKNDEEKPEQTDAEMPEQSNDNLPEQSNAEKEEQSNTGKEEQSNTQKEELLITIKEEPSDTLKPDQSNIKKTDESNTIFPVQSTEESEEEKGYLSILKSKGPLLSPVQLEDLFIEMEDFLKALKSVQPSAKREGFATVPDVTWDDIGSLRDIRSELERSIMMPVKYPKEFALLGISAPAGILLCGPPGCGKTLLAKAVANEANINFISVKGPELLNMYVGESERAVRQCFQRARNSQPCVIFFDEIDALCPKRAASTEGHNTSSRVVNQVLTEMDGVEGRAGVFLMAATNRPDMVDPAVLRPGRLDKILYVGLPSASDRTDILRALTKNGTKPPMKDIDLEGIGSDPLLEGYTGADLAALVKEASVLALTDYMKHKDKAMLFVTTEMVHQAASKIRPSVSPKEREHYEKLKYTYGPSSSQPVLARSESSS